MKPLTDKLAQIASIPDHYLNIAATANHPYYKEFLEAGFVIRSLLTDKEFEYWCTEKMLLKPQPFAEKTFIQYAVETSVVRFFGEKFPADFKVEAKINPTNEKDVDCRFCDGGFIFNVEVKCSDFVSKEKVDNKDGFKFGTIGRLPDKGKDAFDTISAALDEGLALKGEPLKPHLVMKNMDNNLKEFLELAHEKFNPNPTEKEVNILVVGCGDPSDIQNWVNYLYSHEGLFTERSFADRRKYQNVDMVVFTNQYFKHNIFFTRRVRDCWTLDKGFNIIMVNPNRHLPKTEGIRHFADILPNYSTELGHYEVPGSAEGYVKEAVRIPYFVKRYLEETLDKYVFEEKLVE